MTTESVESLPTRVIVPSATPGGKFSTRIFGSLSEAEEYAKSVAHRNPIIQDARTKVPSQKRNFSKERIFKAGQCNCGRAKVNGHCTDCVSLKKTVVW